METGFLATSFANPSKTSKLLVIPATEQCAKGASEQCPDRAGGQDGLVVPRHGSPAKVAASFDLPPFNSLHPEALEGSCVFKISRVHVPVIRLPPYSP